MQFDEFTSAIQHILEAEFQRRLRVEFDRSLDEHYGEIMDEFLKHPDVAPLWDNYVGALWYDYKRDREADYWTEYLNDIL